MKSVNVKNKIKNTARNLRTQKNLFRPFRAISSNRFCASATDKLLTLTHTHTHTHTQSDNPTGLHFA